MFRVIKNKKNKIAKSKKGGLTVNIHPLFFALGFYYALVGKIFLFLTVTACAVLHEIGHSLVAGRIGYCLNKITLMPFGAVVDGDIDGLKPLDQIKVALAGPMLNFAVAIFFIATWWIYPDCYPYTEVAVSTSLSIALVNLLPAYPLDGGRVLFATLSLYLPKQKARVICKIIGVALGVIALATYFLTIRSINNISMLFFATFVVFGALGINNSGRYVRAYTGLCFENLTRGVPVKRLAIDGNATVKKILGLLDNNCVNEILVYDGGKVTGILSQEKIEKIILYADLYTPIKNYLHL